MKPSTDHSNRRLHNWLVYRINDRFLVESAALYRGTLYDLGAGESPYRSFFLEYAKEYIAVDWQQSLHARIPGIDADLNQPLPIPSSCADTVVSLSVLEHLHEPATMLGEAWRILRPGGALILQVPWQWSVHEAPYDFYRYSPYGLRHLLNSAGFSDVQIRPQSGVFSTLFLKWNYFLLRFVPGMPALRYPVLLAFTPLWFILQAVAPVLDRLDRNWEADCLGYFVTARRPMDSVRPPRSPPESSGQPGPS